jgi:hypothetical protein
LKNQVPGVVPKQPEPFQIFQKLIARLLRGARQVRVFDAEKKSPLTFMMPREQPVEQRRSRAADVQISRGTRREPADDRTAHAARLCSRRARSQASGSSVAALRPAAKCHSADRLTIADQLLNVRRNKAGWINPAPARCSLTAA